MKFDVKKLSLDQKLDLLTGKNRWQTNDLDGTLDSVFVADGPHGLRKKIDDKTVPASAMPNLSQIAKSAFFWASTFSITVECPHASILFRFLNLS